MMRTVTIAGVEIQITDGPIGVSLSGGADSSLLLFILMSNHPGPIHVLTCASERKRYASAGVAHQVIKTIMSLTGNNNLMHHTWYVKSQNPDNLFATQDQYQQLGLFDVRYTAVTANPPAEIANFFDQPNTEQSARDPEVQRPTWYPDLRICVPFTNIDKRVVRQMYQELDLMDRLFPITRSCESLTTDHGHCGRCWWCQERQWAFGRL